MDESYELDGETFEWNLEKAASNIDKHGVSFPRACEAFCDPFLKALDASNEHDTREAIIGYDSDQRLLYVVFIERDDEAIRIISARLATKPERSIYKCQ